MKLAVLFSYFGPYHHARLEALTQRVDLVGIEYSNINQTYAWQPISDQPVYNKITLFQDEVCEKQPLIIQKVALETCLNAIQPDAVAIPGWSHPIAVMALSWCAKQQVPVVLMADSNENDEIRRFWKELPKRRILKNSSTAFVGGQSHISYLVKLGFPAQYIFVGYDVVDNTHFAQVVAEARKSREYLLQHYRLPHNFFLASARFIPKKNLQRLIAAYAQYQAQAGPEAWSLVLLGDGPLRSDLQTQIEHLCLSEWIHLPGFKQYDDLPTYYGLAHCFIHASTTEQWGLVVNEAMASGLPVLVSNHCGCSPDLVQDGYNGYTFDPYNPDQLTNLMLKMASGTCNLTAMGQASQAIIAHWSPQTFAENLQKAVELALTTPLPKANLLDRALLWVLSRR